VIFVKFSLAGFRFSKPKWDLQCLICKGILYVQRDYLFSFHSFAKEVEKVCLALKKQFTQGESLAKGKLPDYEVLVLGYFGIC